MDPNRKTWNIGQQTLRGALAACDVQVAIGQFLIQHAMLHSRSLSRLHVWSFEDELWEGLREPVVRAVPADGEHSIAWILFHMARIEDITMSRLVAGQPQLYTREDWAGRLQTSVPHSANRMSAAAVAALSAALDLSALRKYRLAVGRQTRSIVKKLKAEDLGRRVDPARLQAVLDEGAVLPAAMEIVQYWGNRTIAGLLLMPPTRHNFLHLNEALQLKRKLS